MEKNEPKYIGTAKAGGNTFTVTGTILECANWADNIIRCEDGDIVIKITRKDDEDGIRSA